MENDEEVEEDVLDDELIYSLLRGCPEGVATEEILRTYGRARQEAQQKAWAASAALYAASAENAESLSESMDWVRACIFDEWARMLERSHARDEAERVAEQARQIRAAHVERVLAENDCTPRNQLHWVILEHVLPKFVPYINIGPSFRGLFYFDDAPYHVVLSAGNHLGFDFFRGRRRFLSNFSFLDMCYHGADDTAFGGYVVMPPRKDARLSLTSIRTRYTSDIDPLLKDADEVKGRKKFRSVVEMYWR